MKPHHLASGVLLVVALLAVGTWSALPTVLPIIARNVLDGYGWRLDALDVARPQGTSLTIRRVTVQRAGSVLSARGVTLSPLPASAMRVTIASLDVTVAGGTGTPPTVGLLLQGLHTATVSLPASGYVERTQLCQDGTCIAFELHWQKRAAGSIELVAISRQATPGVIRADVSPGHVEIGASGSLTLPGTEVTGLLDATVTSSDASDPIELAMLAELAANTRFGPGQHVQGRLDGVIDATLPVDQPVTADLVATLSPALLRLHPGALIDLDDWQLLTAGAWQLSRIEERDNTSESPRWQLDGGAVTATRGDLVINATAPRPGTCGPLPLLSPGGCTLPLAVALRAEDVELAFDFDTLDIRLSGTRADMKGDASVTVIRAGNTLATGQVRLVADPVLATLTGTNVQLLGIGPFSVKGTHNLGTGAGELAAIANEFTWPQALTGFDVSGGTRSIEATANWRTPSLDTLSTSVTLSLANATLHQRRLVAKGATLDLAMSGWPRLVTEAPARFSAAQIDAGITLTAPVLEFDLDVDVLAASAHLTGRSLTAGMLGGTLDSHRYHLLLPGLDGDALIDVTALDLQNLLSLEDRGFVAAGKLEGSVPVQIHSGQWSITGGSLEAIAPGGFLRYAPDSAAAAVVAGSTELTTVASALSDFRFYNLAVGLDYGADGILNARTAMKGSNPEFQQGREVHLNVNIEENLGDLLRSLTVGDKITENIDANLP